MEIIEFERKCEVADLLKVALEKRNLIPIIGSGFTKGEKARNGLVPDGKEFQNIMIEMICKHCTEIKKSDFLQEGYKFSQIADEFFKRVPQTEYKQILKNRFTSVQIHSSKRRFLQINWPYIYTLNIDDAIEKNSKYVAVRPYKRLSDYAANSECVFKMHGDVYEELNYDEMPNIIFSSEQYIKSLESNSPILSNFKGDYSSKCCVFIGCSLDDELDLKYAISTNCDLTKVEVNRVYVTSERPTGLRYSRLEDFGITKVLLVSSHDDFYEFLFDIYDKNRFIEEKPFSEYKNPIIEIYGTEIEKNKEYLVDLVGAKSSEKSLPFYSQKREIYADIYKKIPSETVTIIAGKRFSGKTTLAKYFAKSINYADTYFFSSDVSFNATEIRDLGKIINSVLIFDTDSLDISNVAEIGSVMDAFNKNEVKLIIFANSSDNLFHSAVSRLTNNNYYRLDNKLSHGVVKELNNKLSQIGLIESDPNITILDNCYRYFQAYDMKSPLSKKIISDREVTLLIILATEHKIYSVVLNIFDIPRNDLESFVSKMSPFIEIQGVGIIEAHQHSGYKIVSNSSSWLFKILGEYQASTSDQKLASIILNIVSRLKGKLKFENIYKKIISFDNLNQIFYRKEGGSINLIFNVYKELESILYDDGHFWLQRAKSILHLKRYDIDQLQMAKDYAKKSYYDTENFKLQINATTTLALIYGRIANLEKFKSSDTLINAIEWYYAAFQENQYNKRYIDEIIETTNRNGNDIKELCAYILGGNCTFEGKIKNHAEFLINKIIQENKSKPGT